MGYTDYIDIEEILFEYRFDTTDDEDEKYIVNSNNNDLEDAINYWLDLNDRNENTSDIKKMVNEYGIFKAIEEYKNEYGDDSYELTDFSFIKTYGTLAYYIIINYIRDNELVLEIND
jgi:hypothetical protein